MINEISRIKDDIQFLGDKEEEHMGNRDMYKRGDESYQHHQKRFGIYYRARVRAEHLLKEMESRKRVQIPEG